MADIGEEVCTPMGLSVSQLQVLPMACVGIDAAGRVTFWNASAASQFGRAAEAALGQPAAGLLAVEEDRSLLMAGLHALRSGAAVCQRTLRAPGAGGLSTSSTWALLASHGPDGSFAGAMAVCQSSTAVAEGTQSQPPLAQPLLAAEQSRQASVSASNGWDRTEADREALVESLERERRRLDAVLRQLPAMLVITDADGLVRRANAAFLEMLGVTLDEVIGRAQGTLPFTIVDQDGRPLEMHEVPSVRALRGEHVSVEVAVPRGDTLVRVHVLASPIHNEQGDLDGAVLTLRDVTAERAAATTLRATEATNRALLDAIPDSLYRVRRDGTIKERRAPHDGREWLHQVYTGRRIVDLIGPSAGQQLMQGIERAFETGRLQTVEYTPAGGSEVLYREARVVVTDLDEVLLLVRDISDRRRAEHERERLLSVIDAERRRLNAVFRQAPNGLLVYDSDGKIVEINDALAANFGRPKADIIGLTASEAGLRYRDEFGQPIPAHDLPSARALRGQDFNGVVFGGVEHRPVWLQVSASPIRDDAGVVVGAIVASRNITADREAAEALRASEARNRALLAAIPDTIYVGGRDGIIRDFKAPGDGRPMPSGEIVGRHVTDLWPAEIVAPVMNAVERVLDHNQMEQVEYLVPSASGQVYREARIVPYGDERVLVLVRDVNARRRAEQERERLLQKVDSERRRLDAILRQLPHTLIVLDRDGRIEEVNDGLMAGIGLPKERIIGQTSATLGMVYRAADGRLLEPDELPSFHALAGREYSGELRVDGPEGNIWWIQTSAGPILDERGDVTGAIVTTRNVTSERESMVALQVSEARIRALLDAIPDSMYVRDREGTLLDYKPPRDGRPMQLEPRIGLRISDMWPGEIGDEILRTTSQVLDTGQLQIIEYQVPTPAGPAYREARVVPSGPNQTLALVRDIDARKQAEQALHALNLELEQRVEARTSELEAANHELEAFSYSVSHDLKAPLRGIDGYSGILWEDYQDRLDDDGRVLLRNVRQGAAQMYQLIDDLLAYSRLERRVIDQYEIDLPPIIEGLLDERTDEIAGRGVQLTVDVPPITVRADRDGLAQAIRNLLENALRFTGSVESPNIAISATVAPDCCILSVRDNGIGFDMTYHDRIFEIFQRLHRIEEYPGTGIGLALVRKAMQRMGGRVWAESVPGSGATFFLELPR